MRHLATGLLVAAVTACIALIAGPIATRALTFQVADPLDARASLDPLVSRAGLQADDLLGHWEFSPEAIDGRTLRDLAGGHDGALARDPEMVHEPGTGTWALVFDGVAQSAVLSEDVDFATLPRQELTLEAWACLFTPTRWGGIIGALQDNGGAEAGWVLGYDETAFTFGLATVGADDGDGLMTYLAADTPIELRRWYHVTATYDGAAQRVYVNGQPAGSATVQSGDVMYPDQAWYEIGAYHDANEYFFMHGMLAEVRVYDRALSPSEVADRIGARPGLADVVVPTPTPRPTPTPGPESRRRVLVVGMDGVRPDALQAADTPNLDMLIAAGAWSMEAQTGPITSSGPGWSSMLTGVWTDKHGVTSNSFVSPRFDDYPHFFARYKAFLYTGLTASLVHWSPINSYIAARFDTDFALSGVSDATVAGEAARLLIEESELAAMFLQLDDPDGAGHGSGYDPPYPPGSPYRTVIETTDAHVGSLLAALDRRPGREAEEWLIIVSTDHGGSGFGHGQDIPEHRTIFVIVSGDGAARGEIVPAPQIVDVAATALRYLGLQTDPAWGLDGVPVGLSLPDAPEPTAAGSTASTSTPPPPATATEPRLSASLFLPSLLR